MIKTKKGESIIEVLLAMTIFSVAAVSTVASMSFSLYTSQADLEIAQARNELDAQAEALRFIHANYAANKTRGDEARNVYTDIWRAIKQPALANSQESNEDIYSSDTFTAPSYSVCSDAYDTGNPLSIDKYNSFSINTRTLAIDDGSTKGAARTDAIITSKLPTDGTFNPTFQKASTYPRFTYTNGSAISGGELGDQSVADVSEYLAFSQASSIEGIWTYAIPSKIMSSRAEPEYIDYYINTCWYPQGKSHAQTISTTIRLYNPDYNEIAVTEKPAFYINYYHRTTDGGWTLSQVLTRANVDASGHYSLDIKDEPAANQHDGYMFAGWMTATDAEVAWITDPSSDKETSYTNFKRDKTAAGTFKGEFCQNRSSVSFHPECVYDKMTTDATQADANTGEDRGYGLVQTISVVGDADHVDLIMVEKPPMDVAVIFDISGSMQQELNGAKKGLINLGNAILGNTIGKMSLTTIYSISTVQDVCSLGYQGLAGTCGESVGAPLNFKFNQLVNSAVTNSGNAPEAKMNQTVYNKAQLLANPSTVNASYEPAYNKMIILLTDTYSNNTNYNNQIINLVTQQDNNTRIYVIQSYGSTGGSDWNRALSDWGPVAARSGGAVIKADQILGHYSGGTFAGDSKYSYDWNSGQLIVKPSTGSCITFSTYYDSTHSKYKTTSNSITCPETMN